MAHGAFWVQPIGVHVPMGNSRPWGYESSLPQFHLKAPVTYFQHETKTIERKSAHTVG